MAKFIASLLVAIAVTVFASIKKADKEEISESVRRHNESFAQTQVEVITRQVIRQEEWLRLAITEGDRMLALENLRESRAELRRYQSQLSR